MKDEQIASILQERFDPLRATQIPQPRRRLYPRLTAVTIILASLSVATVVYTGLGPTPAQAMERVNQALKGVRSFRVEISLTKPDTVDTTHVVIVQSGDISAAQIERDPMSMIYVAQGDRVTYLPKGAKVAYTQRIKAEKEAWGSLRSGEEPLDFVLRTYWLNMSPVNESAQMPVSVVEEKGSVLAMNFVDDTGKFDNGYGVITHIVRKGTLRVDKKTSRPIDLRIEDVDRLRLKPYTTSYRFTYDKDTIRSPRDLFPNDVKIVDLGEWASRQAAEWRKRPLVPRPGHLSVLEAFTSTDGWTMLITDAKGSPAEKAVDQKGGQWFVSEIHSEALSGVGLVNLIVAPLDPYSAPSDPELTLTVANKSVKVSLPEPTGQSLPTWLPLADTMTRVFRYAFYAEGLRAAHYKELGDTTNELIWQKAMLEKFKRFPGKMQLPATVRIKQLEASP